MTALNARALPLYATIAIFLVAYLICYLQFPATLSTRVVGNLLTDNAYLGIVVVGMTVVILSGGIDLSVGSVIAFSGVFIAVMLRDTGLHPLIVFPLLLAVTTAFGAEFLYLNTVTKDTGGIVRRLASTGGFYGKLSYLYITILFTYTMMSLYIILYMFTYTRISLYIILKYV